MIWMEQYTDKRLRELQQDVIRNRWHTIELWFSDYQMPSSFKRRVMPYEHNGSSHFIASNFRGSGLHRQS